MKVRGEMFFLPVPAFERLNEAMAEAGKRVFAPSEYAGSLRQQVAGHAHPALGMVCHGIGARAGRADVAVHAYHALLGLGPAHLPPGSGCCRAWRMFEGFIEHSRRVLHDVEHETDGVVVRG